MFYPDSYLGYLSIHLFIFFCQWVQLRCFLRSHDLFELHKSCITISEHAFDLWKIFYSHFFQDWTVMLLSFTGFWEDQDTLGLICNNAILDGMSLLFSWVELLLYFSFLWSLNPALTAIQEEIFEVREFTNKCFYIPYFSLWKYLSSSESCFKNREIVHDPIMYSSFARAIPEESHHLKGEIESNISQNKEELFFSSRKKSLRSSPSHSSLKHLSSFFLTSPSLP